MPKKMLIDAAHAEETRVVVLKGNQIEDFDFESRARKQLRGNIYLAKVTRVEPSLQAAFVEYGGNRHGFLAFNEIHPDYYQIPHADREALMREAEEGDDEDDDVADDSDEATDSLGGEDEDEVDEEIARRRRRLMRRYKIQEVIKRRQIMLVQVVKEERGTKGAALTTYLSLAGRYCVLMPNTARGGGISRKITSATDRKRLKSAVQSLEVPKGMGLIIRTAGAARTKVEIKRDYEYLLRLWENIREKTLGSIAPALIYEEEDLVKRAIRDMFDKDLDSIQVEGEAGYKEARDFMRMIMPSQAKKVVHYREPTPLFVKHRIEDQIAQIHSPVVQLKSGGYLVINQTEALVAIDVNSGRATKERNIETTALKTNLEAAEEAARQMRLRDLAGLIVIDFIDMDEGKNNRAVEKVLKDALKDDRARIQMGKISGFGLMEISRQRRRTGVLEGSTHVCEHCQGTGRVRSVESSAVATLRAIEMESVKGGAGAITVRMPTAVALYILNEKRAYLANLDSRYDLHVSILIDDKLAAAEFEIERTESREGPPRELVEAEPEPEWTPPEDQEDDEIEAEEDEAEAEAGGETEGEDGEGRRGRARRRRRRGGRREDGDERPAQNAASEDEDEDGEDDGDGEEDRHAAEDGGSRRRRRRRGRRGGRRLREEGGFDDVYAWRDPNETRRSVEEGQRSEGQRPERGESRGDRQRDVYAWRDPQAQDAARAEGRRDREDDERGGRRGRNRRRGRGRGEGGLERSVPETFAAAPEPGAYAWSDTSTEAAEPAVSAAPLANDNPTPAEPIAAEAPARRPRRGRGGAALAEAVPTEAADAVAEAVEASAPIAPPEPEAAPAPAPEPVAAAPVAEPAPAPEPDPNEISAPPATPRRGWWRRLI